MEMSKQLEQLVADYKKEDKAAVERSQKTAEQVAEYTEKLAEARAKLKRAIDASLENLTEENAQAEHESRKEVTELELKLKGAEDRKARAFSFNGSRKQALSKQAVELAKKEAQEYYHNNQPKAAQKVADAKVAYLGALADYYKLGEEAKNLQKSVADQVGFNMQNLDFIHTSALHPFYFGGSKQLYGVTEREVLSAINNGIIRKNSVEDGNERE